MIRAQGFVWVQFYTSKVYISHFIYSLSTLGCPHFHGRDGHALQVNKKNDLQSFIKNTVLLNYFQKFIALYVIKIDNGFSVLWLSKHSIFRIVS